MMQQSGTMPLSSLKSKSLIVCFSQLRWSFVFQRPQHLMTKASQGHQIIFWEEPVFAEIEAPQLEWRHESDNIDIVVPLMPNGMEQEAVDKALCTLLDQMLASHGSGELIFWYGTPMMLKFSRHHEPDLIVYDNMDELSAFLFAPQELKALEQELLNRADIVFTGGMSIYEAKKHRHHNIYPMPSSIDQAHFALARNWRGVEPEDQSGIPHPRIGWFGVIDERMDSDFLGELIRQRPDWQFIMLGPIVKIDPASLPHGDNIHWLGMKNYGELPAYLAGWDAGFIPYALNASTEFISPTKTPEFLAAGVPLVATPVKDIVRPYGNAGVCEIVTTPSEMAEALDRAISRERPAFHAQVDALLEGQSWDRTWAEMEALMRATLQARTLKESA